MTVIVIRLPGSQSSEIGSHDQHRIRHARRRNRWDERFISQAVTVVFCVRDVNPEPKRFLRRNDVLRAEPPNFIVPTDPKPSYPSPKLSYPSPKPSYPSAESSYPRPKSSHPSPKPSYPSPKPSYPSPKGSPQGARRAPWGGWEGGVGWGGGETVGRRRRPTT